jgi:hypothetical protein
MALIYSPKKAGVIRGPLTVMGLAASFIHSSIPRRGAML